VDASIADLDTPVLLVDRSRLEHNVATFAKIAEDAGVELRPHVKTHKTVEIARLQLGSGAVGITVAKLSEAEVYAEAGVEDIFVAYPVIGEHKWRKSAELARKTRLIVGVESFVGVEGLARAAGKAGIVIDVRAEFDSGLHRSGVNVGDLSRLCAQIAQHASLHLEGIFTFRSSAFPGSAGRSASELGQEEGEILARAAAELRDQGFPITSASGGSTPTARAVAGVPGVTEIRPGTYVFHDLMSRADNVCDPDDIALSVLTTVVSRPSPLVAIVDAGSKTLAGDVEAGAADLKEYGEVYGGCGHVAWLNEEHAAVQLAPDHQPNVGDRLRLLPVHVCTAVNLADELVLVDGDHVLTRWPVTARGCNR
jgi:D-serine deaminase-like pyridoxal phosphate-dependent protein